MSLAAMHKPRDCNPITEDHMTNLTIFTYNNQVISRRADGFVNLTQMCEANGTQLIYFTRQQKSQEYKTFLADSFGSPVLCKDKDGQTWGHPSFASHLARWISPQFAIWCDENIFQLMTTSLKDLSVDSSAKLSELSKKFNLPKTYSEALIEAGRLALELELVQLEKKELEIQADKMSETIDELYSNYSSIIRVAKFNNISESSFAWQRLKALSEKMGLEIKKVECPRFGHKNLYHHKVWREAYTLIKLPENDALVARLA